MTTVRRPIWIISVQDDDRRVIDGLSFYETEDAAQSAMREFLLLEVGERLEGDPEESAGDLPAMTDDGLLDMWSEQHDGVTVEVNKHWIEF
jgi:hypothetical protein